MDYPHVRDRHRKDLTLAGCRWVCLVGEREPIREPDVFKDGQFVRRGDIILDSNGKVQIDRRMHYQSDFVSWSYVLINAYGNKVCGSDEGVTRSHAWSSLIDKIEHMGLTAENVNDPKGPREVERINVPPSEWTRKLAA